MDTRMRALSILDKFMLKSRRVNKPLKTLQKTEEYGQLESTFDDAIKYQIGWVSKNLPRLIESAGISDNLQAIDLVEQQKLKGQITREMPAMADLISEFRVFQNLKGIFEWRVKKQYKNWGYIVKSKVGFELTNPQYIAQLQDRAAYLINQSTLDATTIDDILEIIADNKLNGMTNDEVAASLTDQIDEISAYRGTMIARTESANAAGSANYASMVENGVQTKSWVVAGPGCDVCQPNEDDGEIPVDQDFSSGDASEPAHPNCECYTEAGEIDLSTIDIWGGE